MIEIGETTDARMTYEEAVMYCFCLGDGWRLPTTHECNALPMTASWCFDERISFRKHHKLFATPVRDLKDD
jgi:hypothetical protein